MRAKVRVASVGEVPPGTGKEVHAAGRIVALFNIDGQYYAVDGVCPHLGGPLGMGAVEDAVVTCPWHGWQFDVTTGRHVLNPSIQQERFEVCMEGDTIFVLMDEADM